jgi:hypothetical protein
LRNRGKIWTATRKKSRCVSTCFLGWGCVWNNDVFCLGGLHSMYGNTMGTYLKYIYIYWGKEEILLWSLVSFFCSICV